LQFSAAIPAVDESKVDKLIIQTVNKKFKNFDVSNTTVGEVAELLVSVYSIASKVSSVEVKTHTKTEMRIFMDKLSKKNAIDVTALAQKLQNVGGADGNEIVNGGYFNIFQEEWVKLFKKKASGMSFLKALKELKRLNPKITGEFEKVKVKVTKKDGTEEEKEQERLKSGNDELNHLNKAGNCYEKELETLLKDCRSGDPSKIYKNMRFKFDVTNMKLKEIPSYLAHISAAVALELSSATTKRGALKLPLQVMWMPLTTTLHCPRARAR
jgi:hypothetical protein